MKSIVQLEIPMRVTDLRAELKIGATLMCAIRRQLGVPRHSHRMLKSDVVRLLREEPGFKQQDVYPKKGMEGKI